MPSDAFCNGTSECLGGEDEELAPQGSCCPENKFRCRVDGFQICVEQDLVCDRMEDCDDGEDEGDCKSCSTLSQNELYRILGNRREERGRRREEKERGGKEGERGKEERWGKEEGGGGGRGRGMSSTIIALVSADFDLQIKY